MSFWEHYAKVNDDVRHKLVEEAWFGRQTTGDINQKDMPGAWGARPAEPAAPNTGTIHQAGQGWGQRVDTTCPGTIHDTGPSIHQCSSDGPEHGY